MGSCAQKESLPRRSLNGSGVLDFVVYRAKALSVRRPDGEFAPPLAIKR